MVRNRRLIFIVAVVTALFICLQTGVASAKSLSDIRKELNEKQEALEAGEEKEESLAEQVMELEGKLVELEASISENEEHLSVLEKELKKAEEKVETQNENLGGRLRNMYKNGTVGFIDVLLDSNSFSEFLTNLDLVEKIYSGDKEVLDELQDAYDEIDKKKKEVETLQAELNESKKLAEEEMSTVETQKEKIAASNEETAKMIDALEEESARMSAELAKKASSADSSTSVSDNGSGALGWPCRGTITSNYGPRICPYHGQEFHSGIDIATSYGTPLHAAESGTVILAGWNGGYGNCVVIDHGGSMTTLYGHCASVAVSYGQRVSRGQTIAYLGSTGNSTGPHVHFEVRRGGSTLNPFNFL